MASIFDKKILSKQDLERIDELGRLWTESDDPKAKAEYHEMAEAIRQGYGYSGGADGHNFDNVNKNVVNSATAANDYNAALSAASEAALADIEAKKAEAEADGNERLRQAYIKNMQQKLGLDQSLKAEGITGGMSESTRAALGNNYITLRDDILSDVSSQKQQLDSEKSEQQSALSKELAKNQYDAALSRADMLSEAEAEAFEREMAQKQYELDSNTAKNQYELELQKFDYQKEKDLLDREYEKQRDALERQHELQKIYASKSSSGKSSSSDSDDEKTEQLKKDVWELIEKGVYHESFPAIVGFSEEILMEYIDNIKSGY